jgi:hypothetical protein
MEKYEDSIRFEYGIDDLSVVPLRMIQANISMREFLGEPNYEIVKQYALSSEEDRQAIRQSYGINFDILERYRTTTTRVGPKRIDVNLCFYASGQVLKSVLYSWIVGSIMIGDLKVYVPRGKMQIIPPSIRVTDANCDRYTEVKELSISLPRYNDASIEDLLFIEKHMGIPMKVKYENGIVLQERNSDETLVPLHGNCIDEMDVERLRVYEFHNFKISLTENANVRYEIDRNQNPREYLKSLQFKNAAIPIIKRHYDDQLEIYDEEDEEESTSPVHDSHLRKLWLPDFYRINWYAREFWAGERWICIYAQSVSQ